MIISYKTLVIPRKMWYNVNLIINKKRPSSNIDNLHLHLHAPFYFTKVNEVEVFLLLENIETNKSFWY